MSPSIFSFNFFPQIRTKRSKLSIKNAPWYSNHKPRFPHSLFNQIRKFKIFSASTFILWKIVDKTVVKSWNITKIRWSNTFCCHIHSFFYRFFCIDELSKALLSLQYPKTLRHRSETQKRKHSPEITHDECIELIIHILPQFVSSLEIFSCCCYLSSRFLWHRKINFHLLSFPLLSFYSAVSSHNFFPFFTFYTFSFFCNFSFRFPLCTLLSRYQATKYISSSHTFLFFCLLFSHDTAWRVTNFPSFLFLVTRSFYSRFAFDFSFNFSLLFL